MSEIPNVVPLPEEVNPDLAPQDDLTSDQSAQEPAQVEAHQPTPESLVTNDIKTKIRLVGAAALSTAGKLSASIVSKARERSREAVTKLEKDDNFYQALGDRAISVVAPGASLGLVQEAPRTRGQRRRAVKLEEKIRAHAHRERVDAWREKSVSATKYHTETDEKATKSARKSAIKELKRAYKAGDVTPERYVDGLRTASTLRETRPDKKMREHRAELDKSEDKLVDLASPRMRQKIRRTRLSLNRSVGGITDEQPHATAVPEPAETTVETPVSTKTKGDINAERLEAMLRASGVQVGSTTKPKEAKETTKTPSVEQPAKESTPSAVNPQEVVNHESKTIHDEIKARASVAVDWARAAHEESGSTEPFDAEKAWADARKATRADMAFALNKYSKEVRGQILAGLAMLEIEDLNKRKEAPRPLDFEAPIPIKENELKPTKTSSTPIETKDPTNTNEDQPVEPPEAPTVHENGEKDIPPVWLDDDSEIDGHRIGTLREDLKLITQLNWSKAADILEQGIATDSAGNEEIIDDERLIKVVTGKDADGKDIKTIQIKKRVFASLTQKTKEYVAKQRLGDDATPDQINTYLRATTSVYLKDKTFKEFKATNKAKSKA